MNKKRDVFDIKLSDEERALYKAIDSAIDKKKLKSVKNLGKETDFAKKAAANYFRKNAKINIRLTQFDLEGLKRIAAKEGLPYQTLISSILHKYVVNATS